MSSGIVKKKHLDKLETEEEDSKELFFDISKFVVSFLNVLKKKHPMDNYDEDENIFLKENESEFKNILKQEFADAIKEFSKTIKKEK